MWRYKYIQIQVKREIYVPTKYPKHKPISMCACVHTRVSVLLN